MMVDEYYSSRLQRLAYARIIPAYDDTINEELEHPHTELPTILIEDKSIHLDPDIVNDMLEHCSHPQFIDR